MDAAIELKKKWYELVSRFTRNELLSSQLFAEIEENYSASERFYHNAGHILFMFELSESYADKLENKESVQFAIFYHDLIYRADRHDNEEKSAETAGLRLKEIGYQENEMTKVCKMILATKTHRLPTEAHSPDIAYFLDFDLSILGSDKETYRKYASAIRKEYAIYPDELYIPGRIKVLSSLLERKSLYCTRVFYKLLEEKARQNMLAEIDLLAGR